MFADGQIKIYLQTQFRRKNKTQFRRKNKQTKKPPQGFFSFIPNELSKAAHSSLLYRGQKKKKKKQARKANYFIAMKKELTLKRLEFVILASVLFLKGTQPFYLNIVFKSLKGTIL